MPSLARRLTLSHTVVALLAVLLVALLAGGLTLRAYNQVAETQARRQSRALAQRLSEPLSQIFISNRGWAGVAAAIGRRLGPRSLEGRLLLSDERQIVVYDSYGALVGQPAPPDFQPFRVPVVAAGQTVGFVGVVPDAAQYTAAAAEFRRSLALIIGAGSFFAVAAALLVAAPLARRLVRPLDALTSAARQLTQGQAPAPIAAPQEAELAALAGAFNAMAARLAEQEELRRQLVADIAHELRTPLSVLRLQIESIEDGLVPASAQSVGALSGQLDLLARLVDDLRLLSLADAGQLSLHIQPVIPHHTLAAVARSAEPAARRRGLRLRVEADERLPPARADPQRLAQMLGNLVENALRYTPAGGEVVLRARRVGPAGVAFEVQDSGPGILPADLPFIFERFYRADRARARETGGSGLGLAIVQRLAQAQGGTVSVASTPGAGATFQILLPSA